MSSPGDFNQYQRSRSLSVATVTMQTQTRTQPQPQPQPQPRTPVQNEARSSLRSNGGSSSACYDGRLTASSLELHNRRVNAGQHDLTVLPTPPATSSAVDHVSRDERPRQPRLHLAVPVERPGLGIQLVSPVTTSSVEHISRDERVHQPCSCSYSKSTLPLEHRGMGSWGSEVGSDGSLLPSTQPSPALGGHDDFFGDIHRNLHDQPSFLNLSASSNRNTDLDEKLSDLTRRLDIQREDNDAGHESPFQRFLTPSPADTPTFFTRPAMQQMADVHNGVLTGLQRKDRAERNMAVAAKNKERQAGQTELSLDVEGVCEYSPRYDL